MSNPIESECSTGRCGIGEPCRCDYYADWPVGKKPRPNPIRRRHPGRIFIEGARAGRIDTCRRLWAHLDTEGRVLATQIAAEGDASD